MLVNLTPHAIIIRGTDGDVTIPPTGTPARVEPGSVVSRSTIAGFPVIQWGEGEVVNLPSPTEGVWYIVSAVVGARVRDRQDILCPGTGPNDGAIRVTDGPRKGQIEAVTCLVRP